jgi:hypothetical protein
LRICDDDRSVVGTKSIDGGFAGYQIIALDIIANGGIGIRRLGPGTEDHAAGNGLAARVDDRFDRCAYMKNCGPGGSVPDDVMNNSSVDNMMDGRRRSGGGGAKASPGKTYGEA